MFVLYVGSENGRFYAFALNDNSPFHITGTATVDKGVEAIFTTDLGKSCNWDFGDGTKTTGTAVAVKKTWKTAGTYTVTASRGGSNKATFTVTVTEPPKPFSETKPNSVTTATVQVLATPTQVPSDVATDPKENVTIKFSNDVVTNSGSESTPAVTVKVIEYQAITKPEAKITPNETNYITPPNTEKFIFLMNVSAVENVSQTTTGTEHRLDVMAKLEVTLCVKKEDADKIRFWRYIDGNPSPIPLTSEKLNYREQFGTATYAVFVPGFSTIVATVDQISATAPAENTGTGGGTGGGGSGSASGSYSGLSFTLINPGTGTVSYTTNHPDWPATTFTFDRMTALGVLLASGKNVVTAERWGGVYVHSINGLSPASDSEGWMYQVNGISPGAMANSYPVQNGDKVVWYYSEDMTKPVSASKQVYAFTVSTSASVSEISGGSAAQPGQTTKPGTIASTVLPAETKQIKVTIPDGIKVEKLAVGQKITIDTAVTKLTGTVSINARNIIIIQPGIQITIPLADVVYNGDVATATIRGMTAEIVPVPVTVPKGGYSL